MFSPENISILIFAVAVLILSGMVIHLELKLKKILRGKNANTLDDSIASIEKDLSELKSSRHEIEEYLKIAENRIRTSVRGVATVRFNAFKGDGLGGNQSFATAFLDEKGDGTVISSIYSRERTSVFAKPIRKFLSEYELSEEERSAINLSKQSLNAR